MYKTNVLINLKVNHNAKEAAATENKLYKTNVLINLKVNHNCDPSMTTRIFVVQNECTNKFESKSQPDAKTPNYVARCTKRMY